MERLYKTRNNVRRGFSRDLEERVDYFEKGRIYTAEIKLTPKCSFGCAYCYASSTPACDAQISKEKIMEIIDDCVETDVRQVNWGGGEPLERKDWYEIMCYAKDCGLENLLMTNGMLLSEDSIAKKVNSVVEMAFVHLDTLDKEVWTALHSTNPELHQRQVDGLHNLLAQGFSPDDLALSMTLAKPIFNNDDYKKTLDWAYDDIGTAAILYPYRNFGFAGQTMDYNPTYEEMADAYKYRNDKDGIPSGPGFGSKFYCGTKCYIQSGGEVMGCSMVYSTYVGNVNKKRFRQIYSENSEKLTYQKLHTPKKIKGHCSKCENNTFCWGCRAASELIAGDYEKSDPICWMSKSSCAVKSHA
jgi:radical SAM protein with 4Fe4S-binding SPASM domain